MEDPDLCAVVSRPPRCVFVHKWRRYCVQPDRLESAEVFIRCLTLAPLQTGIERKRQRSTISGSTSRQSISDGDMPILTASGTQEACSDRPFGGRVA